MQSLAKSTDAIMPSLARLQREVQAMSRRIHGQAVSMARNGLGDYSDNVSELLNDLIKKGDEHARVVCFASAAEFGVPMRHQSERCRLAALHTGSSAMRVLYWTAIRRMRSGSPLSRAAPDPAPSPAMGASHNAESRHTRVLKRGSANQEQPEIVLCRACKALRLDPRNSRGHDALQPVSEMYFRVVGNGALVEAQEHQCGTCQANWTKRRSMASPFASWFITRQHLAPRPSHSLHDLCERPDQ